MADEIPATLRRAAHRRHLRGHRAGIFPVLFRPIAISWFVFPSRGRSGWRLLLGPATLILATPVTGLAVAEALRRL